MGVMDIVELSSSRWAPVIASGLHELYKEKVGFNVAIYGSTGGILDAHACVLMAASPTLKTWLAGDPIQGCHSVEIDTITCATWSILLDFIYAGQASVSRQALQDVCNAADKLQMSLLAKACREELSSDDNDLPPLISQRHVIARSSRASIMPITSDASMKHKLATPSQSSCEAAVKREPHDEVIDRKVTLKGVSSNGLKAIAVSPSATETKGKPDAPLDLTKEVSSK